jgi:hypothetical protein
MRIDQHVPRDEIAVDPPGRYAAPGEAKGKLAREAVKRILPGGRPGKHSRHAARRLPHPALEQL